MYKRDVGIVLLSAFAVYFSIKHEGPFTFRKAWFHHLDEAEDDTAHLPAPIVADLNGDGSAEVIVATHDCRIQVLIPRPAGRAGDGFASAGVLAEVNLLPAAWPPELMKAKRAVAMRSGYLDAKPVETVRAPRKQVLIVVLADWSVICMDHNLRVMWTTRAREEVYGPYGWAVIHANIKEVAIHISNHTMRLGDRGVVIVGGSVDLGDLKDEDELEAELEAEKATDAAKQRTKGGVRDAWNIGGVDISKHFSYYAMDGGTGQSRWTHEGQDFHRDVESLAEQVIPQHNYRLEATSAAGRHYGEAACRDFRESILTTFPHRWSSREDTQLRLAHFRRHKEGAGERKGQLAAKTHHRAPRQGDTLTLRPPPTHGLDHKNPVAHLMGKVVGNAKLGGAATRNLVSDQHALAPNVIVAHLEEGIEAVHLYSGRTICKLHLPAGGLHTDLNADGIPDHIQVIGANALGEGHSDTSHKHAHSCWVSAKSGVPPTMHFFNGSICRYDNRFLGLLSDGSADSDQGPLEIASPAVLPRPGPHGLYSRGAGQIMFLNNRGEMTSLDNHGQELWSYSYGLRWASWDQAGKYKFAPTCKAIPLRWGGLPTVVLAAGLYEGVIASENGHVLERFGLPGPARLPLQAVDFNADGLTDVILVTHNGIFGYAQLRRPGGVPFSALLGLLIVAMVFVYITHQARPTNAKKGRSTDRVD